MTKASGDVFNPVLVMQTSHVSGGSDRIENFEMRVRMQTTMYVASVNIQRIQRLI